MTRQNAKVAAFVTSWTGFYGITGGAPPNAKSQWQMLDALRDHDKSVDTFIRDANDDDLTSAMLAVFEHYDNADRSMSKLWTSYRLAEKQPAKDRFNDQLDWRVILIIAIALAALILFFDESTPWHDRGPVVRNEWVKH